VVGPWRLPVLHLGAPGFHRELRARGIPAVAWDRVVHPLLPRERFADAWFLYDHLVLLPVHQGLRAAELETMAATVREAARAREVH
ncbi:MAG TPA: hypothetical protein VJS92_05000, partial [Candidatus Polarisedimenticolaceae bacterium]|nr:hypothetical protein [Candidatus Polarisedimenticolaceae bacterium]